MVFPVVIYGCENWTIKKAERRRIDDFELGVGEDSWESLGLQGDPTNLSERKSILNNHWRLMLKLKLQYFGHLTWRTDSFEKILMLGKIEGGRRRGRQRMRWLDDITETQWVWVWENSGSWWWTGRPGVLSHGAAKSRTQLSDWTEPTAVHLASLSFTISLSLLNSCPLNRWYHPTISSSVVLISSCLQSFSASGSFPISGLFASGGQSIGASASASALPMNIQGWYPLGLTGLILLSKGLSKESLPIPQFESICSSVLSLVYRPTLTSVHDCWKDYSFDSLLAK